MYRIATNACLDFLRRNPRKAHVKRNGDGSEFVEVTWIQPYPDTLLDEVGPSEAEPDAVVVKRESIELAFLTSIQLLPPRLASRAAPVRRTRLVGVRGGCLARDERCFYQ